MVVMKFGGTSIADSQPIVRVASIVGRQPGGRVVVVSALAGVTDRLAQVAETIATSPSAADDVVATVDGLTVHALATTPSTHAVIAIRDDADLPDAMARLHDKYGGSVRTDAPSDGTASSDDPALAGAPS